MASKENGYHGSSSVNHNNHYKKRKVSALRNFPPKCGKNGDPIITEALVDVIVCDDDDDHVESGIVAETQSRLLEENQSIASGPNASGAVGHNIIENEAKNGPDGVEAEHDNADVPHGNATLASTCDDHESISAKTESVVVNNGILTSEMKIQFDEAVLKCPIFLEENLSLDDFTSDMLAKVMDSIHKNPINVKTLDFKSSQIDVKGNVVDLVKELCVKDIEEIPVVAADKAFKTSSRRRKVSVTRNFPPNCGNNGPPLTELDRAGVFYETETLTGIKAECLRTELPSSNEVEHGGSMKATDSGSTEESYRNLIDVAITKDNDESDNQFTEKDSSIGLDDNERVIVHALMAAPNCPWVLRKPTIGSQEEKPIEKPKLDWRKKTGVVAKKSVATDSSKRSPVKKKKNASPTRAETTSGGRCDKLPKDLEAHHKNNEFIINIPPFGSSSSSSQHTDALNIINIPPFGSSSSSSSNQHSQHTDARKIINIPPFGSSLSSCQHTDARNKVKEILRLYQTICRKIIQGEETKSEKFEKNKRIDLVAKKVLDQKGINVNTDKDRIGSVPGVEVGDEFQYRVELAIVGVHRLYQAGIDYTKKNDLVVATSIVASGAYADGWDNADVLIYSGQGGNVVGKKKEPEDQKLQRGNLALSNSAKTKNPIRVVRGSKETKSSESQDSKSSKAVSTNYVYDGLYTVEKFWPEIGPHGKMVYMFELRRIPGQPELAWKEVKNARIGKLRRGVCVGDISGGQEKLPICAVNLIDDEKPPSFNYIRQMKYPNGFDFIPPQGCSCTTRCSDSRKCYCRPRNGGELPYNRNGAIVEVKPIVYECGPTCKCPPSCYNRVSQNGIKIQLEIFKTENRGWGVRSLASIPSGSFICEYAGELLEDKEAELRTGSDEYLFDVGKRGGGGGGGEEEVVEEGGGGGGGGGGGYTVDAAVYGNVGRFINHCCTPNLYAQDVLHDHDDKKMPHVMLFAADNIPPLQELTYDYNYSMNQVHDSNGNIKMKSCYCGSSECRGRLY